MHNTHLLLEYFLMPVGEFAPGKCLPVYLPKGSGRNALMALTGRACEGIALPYSAKNFCTMFM
jgi:hypothetical protein